MKSLIFFWVIVLAILGVIIFHSKIYIPIELSILIFLATTVFLCVQFKLNNIGIVFLFSWFIYAMPFIHILSYIGFDFASSPTVLWGLSVNPYMVDEEIVKLTAMIGAMGSLGIVLGSQIDLIKIHKSYVERVNIDLNSVKFLSLPIWLMLVSVGFFLTVLSSPDKTVFSSAYGSSNSQVQGANIDSAWVISYVLLTFAFCDAMLCPTGSEKKTKIRIIISVISIIILNYQLLRGDRESLPWLLALLMVKYYFIPRNTNNNLGISARKLFAWLFAIVFVSFIIGGIRSGIAESKASEIIGAVSDILSPQDDWIGNVFHGTWSACLLTPLSVAGDHVNDMLPINYGKDYVDFILSIPPGIIADAIGYVRPIDSLNGPAHQMRYGGGGTHATVVPFMNFRMIGVLFIPVIWAHLINKIEKKALFANNVLGLSVLVTLIMIIPHWMWYGEKPIITTALVWCFTAFMYQCAVYLK